MQKQVSFTIDTFLRKCHSVLNAQTAVYQNQYQSPKATSVRVAVPTIVSRILGALCKDSAHLFSVERKRRRGGGLGSFQLRCRILRGPASFLNGRLLDSQILRVRAHSGGGTEHSITWRRCRNVTANLFDDT